jgi:parvulin-like peptidyl-prolyl isomerase
MLILACSINLKKTCKLGLPLVLLLGLSSCDFFSRRILAKPVAQVENIKLNAKDFSSELANKLKDMDALAAKDSKVLAVHRDQIINDFIVSTIVDLWLTENKITITKDELESEIKSISSSYPTDSSFREALNEAGLTFADWSKKIEATVKKKKLFQYLKENAAPVAEDEYLSFYNNNKNLYEQKEGVLLSHIQVSDENQSEIILKLLKRQKFPDVAKQYSAAYRPDFGDSYGWIEKGFLIELDKSFKLPVGAVFGPVKIADSLHIFKVTEKKAFKIKTYVEAKQHVVNDVNSLRQKAQFATWLDAQFKKYSIKKNTAVIESIKVETQ